MHSPLGVLICPRLYLRFRSQCSDRSCTTTIRESSSCAGDVAMKWAIRVLLTAAAPAKCLDQPDSGLFDKLGFCVGVEHRRLGFRIAAFVRLLLLLRDGLED